MNNHLFLAVIFLGSKNVEVWDSLSTEKSHAQWNELVVALVSHVIFVGYITVNVSLTHIFSMNLICVSLYGREAFYSRQAV